MAETLRASGYSTLAIGKWHLCKDADLSEGGSKHSWPIQRGFEQYYGFLEALTNFHHPHRMYDGNSVVATDKYPDDYYLTDDLTNRAVRMIKEVKTANPEKPFFLYYGHGAVHAPLHAKKSDIAKYRGRYDKGWDDGDSNQQPGEAPARRDPAGAACIVNRHLALLRDLCLVFSHHGETINERRSASGFIERPDSQRLVAPPDVDLVNEDEVFGRADQHLFRRLRAVELVRSALGHPFKPCGGVGGVAERRVLKALLGADIAGDHAAAVEADPHPETFSKALLLHPLAETGEVDI